MAAALANYKIALVTTSWTISHLVGTNRRRNYSSPLVGAPFLVLQAVFSQEKHSLVREPLTSETLLISGRGQGHKLQRIASSKTI